MKLLSLARHILAAGLLSTTLALPAQADVGLLVPAYFHPTKAGAPWTALANAAARVPLVVILNPNSGPGNALDAAYPPAIAQVQAAGGTVIGYVSTVYGQRPADDVLADIARYESLYDIDGIFLDEMSNEPDSAGQDYYAALYAQIKSAHPDWLVVGNPGINTEAAYLQRPTADVLVVFEDKARNYRRWSSDPWMGAYPAEHFAHLIYNSGRASEMPGYVKSAVGRRAGLVYVTSDGGTNPWDTLPPFWKAEVDCVARINAGFTCR